MTKDLASEVLNENSNIMLQQGPEIQLYIQLKRLIRDKILTFIKISSSNKN